MLVAGEGHDKELGTWRRGRAGTRGPRLVSSGADDDEGGEDAGDRTTEPGEECGRGDAVLEAVERATTEEAVGSREAQQE